MPPSYAWKPSIKEFPWNTTVFSSEIIWFSQTKNLRRKIVITPIMKRVFRYPNFSQKLKDAHEKFRHCVTKNFRRKKVIPPFSSTKLFKTRNFLKTVGLPYEIFRHCETSKFWLKIVICALLSTIFFRYQNIPGKRKVSFTQCFVSVLWNKKLWQNRDALPLSMHEKFCQKIFSETPQSSAMNFFGTVRQKFFDGKTWYPLLWKKIFDTANFLKHWRDAHEGFHQSETWNFRRKTWYPPFFLHKTFRNQKLSQKQ